MIGTAIIYTPDAALIADDTFCPRVQGVTVEQAAALCAEHLVMWTAGTERFGVGFHVPSPYTRFFLYGHEILNPWAAFKPLDEYPVRLVIGQGRPDREPAPAYEVDAESARLLGAFDD